VKNPALGLIVFGALGILAQLMGLLIRFGLFAMPGAFGRMPMAGGGAFGGVGLVIGIVIAVVGIAVNLFVIFGAMQMKRLKNYPLALAGAAAAIIPFFSSCCCFLGIGLGIWAIVVLLKPDVKAAFSK
jgi:hypothetical protein